MRVAYNNVSTLVGELGSRLTAMENKMGEFRKMLTSMDDSVTPTESSFSHSLSEEVTDLIDIDHEI